MYHNIADGEQQIDFTEWQPAYDVSLNKFIDHLACFRQPAAWRERLHLTFDDGYASIARCVWPLLERESIRCTCFMTTSALGARGMLHRAEISALAQAGVQFGTHSHSHIFLSNLTGVQMEQEVLVPQKILTDLIGKKITMLSLPGGRSDDAMLEYAHACGYREIFTSIPGYEAWTSTRIPGLRFWPRWVINKHSTRKEIEAILHERQWHFAKKLLLHRCGKLSKRLLGNQGYHFFWQNLQYLKTSFRSGRDTS